MAQHRSFHHTLLMVLVCILPLFLFFVLALSGVAISPIVFLLFLVLCCAAMFYFMRGAPMQGEQMEEEQVKDESVDLTLTTRALNVFEAQSQKRVAGNLVVEGKLLVDSNTAYNQLQQQFERSNVTPLLQEDDNGKPLLVLVPGTPNSREAEKPKTWINLVLFALTFLTTTWAGASHQGINLWTNPAEFVVGLPYALALIVILGAHELGHYFAAKAHNMKVTLPYFIPVPFALGTFGAFIRLKSPSSNRRALFDVGVAGPLAGLVVAIPALLIGLQYSTVVPESPGIMGGGASIGSSVLFALLSKLALGGAVTEGHQLLLHPVAFAGWLGLLVTALNLLPIGQLDGGHIAHALFGRKNSNTIGMVALFSLFLLGLFVWSGLLTWAIIVFFIAGTKSAPPLNDVSRLDPNRVAIGAFTFVLLFLILVPVPHAFYQSLGIHCPYV